MTLTDTHVHFDRLDAEGGVAGALGRAAAAGVGRMIAIGGKPEANAAAIALAAAHPETIRAAVAYDRGMVGEALDMDALGAAAADPHVVAVGETGIDFHYGRDSAEEQIALFRDMLALARVRSLPVVIHSRECDDATLAAIDDHLGEWAGAADAIGVLHCFTGDAAFARQLLDRGLHISFSGIVTFKKSDDLRRVAAEVPEDRLLIETDAPFLAPVPVRGRANEPAYVRHVAETLATVRGVSVDELAATTSRNAERLFGITAASS